MYKIIDSNAFGHLFSTGFEFNLSWDWVETFSFVNLSSFYNCWTFGSIFCVFDGFSVYAIPVSVVAVVVATIMKWPIETCSGTHVSISLDCEVHWLFKLSLYFEFEHAPAVFYAILSTQNERRMKKPTANKLPNISQCHSKALRFWALEKSCKLHRHWTTTKENHKKW